MNEPLRRDRKGAEHLRRLQERKRQRDGIVLRRAHRYRLDRPVRQVIGERHDVVVVLREADLTAARDVGRRDDDRNRPRQLVGVDYEHLLEHEDAERVFCGHVQVASRSGSAPVPVFEIGAPDRVLKARQIDRREPGVEAQRPVLQLKHARHQLRRPVELVSQRCVHAAHEPALLSIGADVAVRNRHRSVDHIDQMVSRQLHLWMRTLLPDWWNLSDRAVLRSLTLFGVALLSRLVHDVLDRRIRAGNDLLLKDVAGAVVGGRRKCANANPKRCGHGRYQTSEGS